MKTIGEFIVFIFMVGLLILIVPTIFEIICDVLVIFLQVVAVLWLIGVVAELIGSAFSSNNGEKTWNYA